MRFFFQFTSLGLILLMASCTGNKSNFISQDSSKSQKEKQIANLKTLNEIKLALLDSRNEKAELLLGKPDVIGQIMMGDFYYMVYFSKVNDSNQIKHLVLLIDGKGGIDKTSSIYRIEAVNEGETISGAGNFAQWLKVSKNGLTSNAMDFSYGDSDKTWLDVSLTNRGKIKSSGY